MRVWDEKSLRETFSIVVACGRAVVQLATAREANSYRLALYNLQRRDSSLPRLTIRMTGIQLIVTEKVIKSPEVVQ
jgi:hypothetical protein